jgi:hypothetical protein
MYDPSISTEILISCLLGYRESNSCQDPIDKHLISQTVVEIIALRKLKTFWMAGFIATNLLWVAHYLGYL